MARALFFQSSYFYENSPVDENADYDLVRPVIWDAQELYIKDIIGQPLYEVIRDEIISNNGTLTTNRLVTLNDDYIAPCLLNYVLMDVQTNLLYKMRNRSLSTDRSEFSDPVDFKSYQHIKDNFKIKAEQYAERIQRYLVANSSTFPEYTTYSSSDQVRAQNQRPSTSVYIGGNFTSPVGYGWEYYEKK